jgi:uracil-DNA glycosylase
MGGETPIDAVAARSALAWWLQAGVDVAIREEPRNWLSPAVPMPEPFPDPAPLEQAPDTLRFFQAWLAESRSLPGAVSDGRRVLPMGAEAAPVMLLADIPSAEDAVSSRPIGGDSWTLAQRMLEAIGISPSDAYVASLSVFHAPGDSLGDSEIAAWSDIARRHVALARPKRLLLLGNGPSKALLGKVVARARAHVHKVEGVRTVATFHPRTLLKMPARKADAWRDLLLLMEDEA